MLILAIETSCDETSAAVVVKTDYEPFTRVLSNVTASSLPLHAKTGGIIPEQAAREQVKYIIPVIVEALIQSNKLQTNSYREKFEKSQKIFQNAIDAIAVTVGPGLIGSLLVGVETAKTISFAMNKPLIPVNHLLGHIYANFINSKLNAITFPFIGLIVSGGHTDLLFFRTHNDYKWLGGTRDDAAGEALDKIGRLLKLSYPAGPEIEKRAKLVTKTQFLFKSPLLHTDDFDFSFSGLKTEVARFVNADRPRTLDEKTINEICFATQKAVIDVLVAKTLRVAEKYNVKTIYLGGGVSANQTLRDKFNSSIINHKSSIKLFAPAKSFCTDNAAMIGAYAAYHPQPTPWKSVDSKPELYFS